LASTLYVETNYPVGYAKGQDGFADGLVNPGLWPFRLAIPDICLMEALSVLNAERKTRRDFVEKLRYQIREAQRNQTSPDARSLQSHLEQAEISADRTLCGEALACRPDQRHFAILINVGR